MRPGDLKVAGHQNRQKNVSSCIIGGSAATWVSREACTFAMPETASRNIDCSADGAEQLHEGHPC